MQLIVLGMHRSGTSALARCLGLIGCHAGSLADFPPADAANPRGYWERRDIWAANEELLAALGGGWDEVDDLDESRLSPEARERFAGRAREIVGRLDTHRPWVIKDPRLCLTLPFWLPFLEDPVCLWIHRFPLAVARSLQARDGFSLALGIALWEHYNLAALAASGGRRRLEVAYEDLVASPAATVRGLAGRLADLGVTGLTRPADGAIEEFIDPALARQHSEPALEQRFLPPQAGELARTFAAGRAFEIDPLPPLSPTSLDLLAAHRRQARRLREVAGQLGELTAKVAADTQAYATEHAARLEGERQVVALTRQARELQAKIAEAALAYEAEHEARRRIEATAHELEALAEILQQKIAADAGTIAAEHEERLRLEAELLALRERCA
jgi:hypothetical protein